MLIWVGSAAVTEPKQHGRHFSHGVVTDRDVKQMAFYFPCGPLRGWLNICICEREDRGEHRTATRIQTGKQQRRCVWMERIDVNVMYMNMWWRRKKHARNLHNNNLSGRRWGRNGTMDAREHCL